MADPTSFLLELDNISKSFRKDRYQQLLVLDNINFKMREGEIIALLGKSGSGKSTLLRIIAGLIPASEGEAIYSGQKIHGPSKGIAMVFQNPSLMPWLTVLQNVELGLEALGVPSAERRQRALKAIDIIGLDGFESAFPKELSGGMRQRVGLARAMVVEPNLLLMDEPFSALDVLTADNLRNDLITLWQEQKLAKGIVLVTHNIEEAVLFADRIIIFDSEPGSIKDVLKVNLPREDRLQHPGFAKIIDRAYTILTRQGKSTNDTYRLPDVGMAEVSGLLTTLNDADHAGVMSLADLSDEKQINIDDILPIIETLQMLRFATVVEGTVSLTDAGKAFEEADILKRKELIAIHLKYVPLIAIITHTLQIQKRVKKEEFLDELESHLSKEEAARVLETAIDWGRQAELFAYDHHAEMFSLENPG